MQTLYLLRHARPAPDPALPEPEWPLHAEGRDQAEALVPVLASLGITQIVTSPYPRAQATVAPFARASGLIPHVHAGLSERRLCDGLREDWLEQLRLSWQDFSRELPGGESSQACQQRVGAAVADLQARYPDGPLLLVSHGNALSLYLNQLSSAFGFEQWQAMPTPALYRVSEGRWQQLETDL